MTIKELIEILQKAPDQDQEVQVHDQLRGEWFSTLVIEPDHDGVCEVSVNL